MGAKQARIRVFVADDHPLYREGVVRAIKERPEFELVGESGDGREALEAIRVLEPDVAVVDLRMPSLDGIAIASALDRDGVPTRVLMLSASTEAAIVYDSVAAGAVAYVTKDAGRRTICDAISRVARGDTMLSRDVQSGLVDQIRRRQEPAHPKLSPREREVLGLIADGLSAPDIGKRLYLSPSTVKTHLQSLYGKLDVSDRAAAVAEGMRRGLLE
ncbi:MAG: two-component system, NarL family, nitrate/nitrite response regulator NarL [Solirubrobacteraceae bacterium]|nr:two-component system, NarL family, nitrate/nitrite response regulator NarL [Solirubrobacteraceae bacterium]